jgi:hypothetical protein
VLHRPARELFNAGEKENIMQAWDQVKVIKQGDPYEGQAGLVVKTKGDGDAQQVTVKMDTDNAEIARAQSDLQLLGR